MIEYRESLEKTYIALDSFIAELWDEYERLERMNDEEWFKDEPDLEIIDDFVERQRVITYLIRSLERRNPFLFITDI